MRFYFAPYFLSWMYSLNILLHLVIIIMRIKRKLVCWILPSYSKNGCSVAIMLGFVEQGVSARQRMSWTPSRSSSQAVPPYLACFLIVLILCWVPTSCKISPDKRESEDKLLGVREHVILHCVHGPQSDHSQSSGNNAPINEIIEHRY